MTIGEFNRRYDMHDSCLEKAEYSAAEKKLTLYVTFCEFMQDGYEDSAPANSDRTFTFFGVPEFVFPDNIALSSDEFISQELIGDSISFYMKNDHQPDGYRLTITCDNVETAVSRYYDI